MTDMRQMTALGRSIEDASFAVIDREAGAHAFGADEWQVVRRVIHATADFEFKSLLRFHPDAIRSGVVYGYAGAIDAILRRLYAELGGRAAVIATGGLSRLVVPYTEEIEEIDDLLTLTGLRLLHERNR